MRKTLAMLLLPTAQPLLADDVARVNQFAWMTGCWGFSGGGSSYEEIWTKPTGNSMLGLSRRVSDDGYTREFEYMRITTSGGGGFDFTAQPGGSASDKFNMLEQKGTRVVFERGGKDFPQRVIYEFRAPDSLNARIEGTENGQAAGINFPLKRKPCEFQ